MLKILTPVVAIIALSGCIVHVGGASVNANQLDQRTLQLDIADINTLVAETGAGSLIIIGESGRSTIDVEADIYRVDDENYTLTLERSGSKAELVADISSRSGNNWNFGGHSPRIDVVITMPADLALKLDDGSGSIDIEGLNNNIEIDDSSGSLEIDGGYNIKIDDGSGSLSVKNATGNVDIEDGTGSLTVINTAGKVTVDDGSGSIKIEGAGSLEIINSGAGGVDISDVKGAVNVDK